MSTLQIIETTDGKYIGERIDGAQIAAGVVHIPPDLTVQIERIEYREGGVIVVKSANYIIKLKVL